MWWIVFVVLVVILIIVFVIAINVGKKDNVDYGDGGGMHIGSSRTTSFFAPANDKPVSHSLIVFKCF